MTEAYDDLTPSEKEAADRVVELLCDRLPEIPTTRRARLCARIEPESTDGSVPVIGIADRYAALTSRCHSAVRRRCVPAATATSR